VAAVRDAVSGEEIVDGALRGAVYGTYIHGFFDADGIAAGIAAALHRAKGLAYNPTAVGSAKRYKENQYDALANILRDSLNMDAIYAMLNNPPAGASIASDKSKLS
jgi:adenosylcobyric acid synthase